MTPALKQLLSAILLIPGLLLLSTSAWSVETLDPVIVIATPEEAFDEEFNSDPLERYNRAMFEFNEELDEALIKPVAEGYHDLLPDPVERSISNFFSNLREPFNILNNLLQFKIGDAVSDTVRFGLNTTIGIAGLFDVATSAGLEKHDEDFGQTLAVWGVESGPYFVIPILGSSTIRDAFGTATEFYIGNNVEVNDTQIFKPTGEIESQGAENAVLITQGISKRADLLGKKEIADAASFDPYTFRRDAYLQKREDLIFDGDVPLPELPEDL